MKSYFITSTGTNIGKTYLTTNIINRCNELKIKVNAIKPIISGYNKKEFKHTDSGIIMNALNLDIDYIDEISPWRFKTPISPDSAAIIENKHINYFEIENFCKKKINEYRLLKGYFLIEGVGGTMVPINNKYTILDLMKNLGIPVILVIGSYLGSISHTLNSIDSLRNNNVTISSIVISQSENDDVGEKLTKSSLKNFTNDIPIYYMCRTKRHKNIIDKIINI